MIGEIPFRSQRSIDAEIQREHYARVDKLLDAVLDRTISTDEAKAAANADDTDLVILQGEQS